MSTIDALSSVCVTERCEYVIYQACCVAVRDRKTGEWLDEHHALEERVALVPTTHAAIGGALWDLEIHTFGVRLHAGPVLAVQKPDSATSALLEQLMHHGSWRLRSAA